MNAPDETVSLKIGAAWQGGIYAGLTLHDNTPMHLILLPGDEDDSTWKKAIKWAEQQGGVLPSRIDALVLFQRLKSEFKPEWYWTAEEVAGNADSAWFQHFGLGYQCHYPKSIVYRGRAVRRVAI